MKTKLATLAIAVFASVLFMGGCVQKITSVNFSYTTTGKLHSDSLKTTGFQTIDTVVLKSDLEAELKKNGTTLDLLDELTLKSATVEFTAPTATDNFDKIDNVELWITAPTLPAVKLASKNPVAKGNTIVYLDIYSTSNLEAYLKSSSFGLEVRGTNNAPLNPMDLTATAVWNVKASAK